MKSVLLIAPVFFDYYKEIKKELENQKFDVDFIQDSASASNLYKALSRINKKYIKKPMEKYYKDTVLNQINSKKYDFVFLVAGMTYSFTEEMISEIRKIQKDAIFIMYQWDGEKNITYVKDIHKYFDRVYSFDRIDCENNKIYKFLPLFYIDKYENIGNESIKNYEYDVSYIGTAHPKKYRLINVMSNELKNILKKQFIFQYMPSKLKYIYHKLTAKEYKNAKLKDFKFEKLSSNQITDIYKKSKCILDSPADGQNGLTIRTIECLGAKKKLITTNKDIKNYDFYLEQNILIYDEKNGFDKNSKFFEDTYKNLPLKIYKKYSLKNWIKYIFIEEVKKK